MTANTSPITRLSRPGPSSTLDNVYGISAVLATETCWPSTDPANAVARRAFGLNPDKPYLG